MLCGGPASNWIVEIPDSIAGGYNLVIPVIVSVNDALGQGIAAVSATTTVISGDGSVVSPVITDANGWATIYWMMVVHKS